VCVCVCVCRPPLVGFVAEVLRKNKVATSHPSREMKPEKMGTT
jgi:hypothetical protein